jgi:adenosylmethionine-8-amino-7-oxononanoate aminotransferase
VEVVRAEGAYLYRPDGSSILDAGGGAIVVNVGHGRADVADAIRQAAANSSYVVPTWLTPERNALVEELTSHWLPDHLSRIHLTSGGSEANEAAMKIAVQYQAARGKPEKSRIISRSLSYHGTTITTAGVSGHASRKRGLESILDRYPTIETPYPLRCPLGAHHPDAADYYLKDLQEVIAEAGADNIAALMAEPLNGSSGGAITPPADYWPRAQKILRDNDILLIMDEVMTGFGRTGKRFGSELYGVEPDLLVAGKGMAGGYAAIAGCYGTEEIARTIGGSVFEVMFHTFAALPVSCAAATRVLQILREEDLLPRVESTGAELLHRLQESLGQHPHVAEIRGEGLLIGIEVVKDRETLEQFPESDNITGKLVGYGLNDGVFFYPGGTGDARDIVCIGAPFIIGEEEIDKMVTTLSKALDACTD